MRWCRNEFGELVDDVFTLHFGMMSKFGVDFELKSGRDGLIIGTQGMYNGD